MRNFRPFCSSISDIEAIRSEKATGSWLLGALDVLGIDAIDDLQVTRKDALEQIHRPALERFGQQRVIGIGECADGDPPRLTPRQPMHIEEQPHELGDRDARDACR